MTFNKTRVVSTRHFTPEVLPPTTRMPGGVQGLSAWSTPHHLAVSAGVGTDGATSRVTCLKFSPPFLIAAHADNSIQLYFLRHEGGRRNGREGGGGRRTGAGASAGTSVLVHVSTLYGHAAAVTALAVDGTGKMVTGGGDGIKIWELPRVANGDSLDRVRRSLPEEPLVTLVEKGGIGDGGGVAWLGFDEGKIVAVGNGSGEDGGDGGDGAVKIFSFFDE
ncbi:hypothetical protein HK104_004458 [Borealophlyctis nickersoniae]|nr:hypothetical protein HK104_004458 [Borealophlyctis nickersoniae]